MKERTWISEGIEKIWDELDEGEDREQYKYSIGILSVHYSVFEQLCEMTLKQLINLW